MGRAPALGFAYPLTTGETLESALKMLSDGWTAKRINSQQLSSLARFEPYMKLESVPRVP